MSDTAFNILTKVFIKLAAKTDLLNLEERLTNRMNELSYKLTIRFGSMIVAAVLVLAAIIKF